MDSRVSGVGGWLTLLMSVLFLVACGSEADKDPAPSYRSVEGATMGTYYRVQYREEQTCATSQQTLDELLMAFNQSLSTYIPDSEIRSSTVRTLNRGNLCRRVFLPYCRRRCKCGGKVRAPLM